MPILIRPETEADIPSIDDVTRAAFEDHPHSRQTEPFIVAALRRAGALAVSLVAEDDGRVVGHVAFSPVSMPEGLPGWYGLGPVSVQPERQRRGIGTSLVEEGLAALRALGARGCVLVGEPAFYRRFGFRTYPGLTVDGVPPGYVLALPFADAPADGRVAFHPGFAATG
jgi:putative acetyltransferase